ncbi:MAG: hypothetical protein N3B21_16785 [Clostridia bacterium]|nr:hypothetical protein [Clostridia bacterium]
MLAAFRRYRLIIVVLGIVAVITLTWLVITRQSSNKVPYRGVYVIQTSNYNMSTYAFGYKTPNGAQNITTIDI